MRWYQRQLILKPRPRGFHLITFEVLQQLPELQEIEIGMAQFFIQHTSASLTLNENASPDVRRDMERHFDRAVPENAPYYEHTLEGPDDMPAHIKASMLGSGLMIPIKEGKLALGVWQGLYLCEHRNHGGGRRIMVTAWGQGAVQED